MILAFLYFLGGVGAAVLALKLLSAGYELTVATKALVIALAALSIFLAIASAIGIFATISLNPGAARLYSILFYVWFFLELALEVAVVVMFFVKSFDSLIADCGITGRRGGIGRATAERNCDGLRNKMSWYYLVSIVVSSAIGYYFARRVASFSRYCAERAAALLNPTPTPMAPISTFTPAGTVFASNFPSHSVYATHATPAPNQASVQSPNNLVVYPQSYQASADSIQTGEKVGEAPSYYNSNASRAV